MPPPLWEEIHQKEENVIGKQGKKQNNMRKRRKIWRK
jgi:hypothetical protein